MDRFDAAGLFGLALVTAGVWAISGWAWSAILLGGVLVGLYTVREVRAIVTKE